MSIDVVVIWTLIFSEGEVNLQQKYNCTWNILQPCFFPEKMEAFVGHQLTADLRGLLKFEENGNWFWIAVGKPISHTHPWATHCLSHTQTHTHANTYTNKGLRQAFLRLSGVNLFLSWGPDKGLQGALIITSLSALPPPSHHASSCLGSSGGPPTFLPFKNYSTTENRSLISLWNLHSH